MHELVQFKQKSIKTLSTLITYEERKSLNALLEYIHSNLDTNDIYFHQSAFCKEKKLHVNCTRTIIRYLCLMQVIRIYNARPACRIYILNERYFLEIYKAFIKEGEAYDRMDRRRDNARKKIL